MTRRRALECEYDRASVSMEEIATNIRTRYDCGPQVPGLIGRDGSIAQPHKLALNRRRVEGRRSRRGWRGSGYECRTEPATRLRIRGKPSGPLRTQSRKTRIDGRVLAHRDGHARVRDRCRGERSGPRGDGWTNPWHSLG